MISLTAFAANALRWASGRSADMSVSVSIIYLQNEWVEHTFDRSHSHHQGFEIVDLQL
jgi:hypothetical protein